MRPPIVEVEGSNYEMGLQYGRKYGHMIKDCISTNYSITKYFTGLTPYDCRKNVRGYIPFLEEAVPHLWLEIKGISEGSGIMCDDLLALNFHGRDLAGGCTSFFVNGETMEDGRAVTGQTIDWNPSLQPYYHVLHLKPAEGPEVLQFTLAGILGLVGKNAYGLSVCMNMLLTTERIDVGMPAYLMLRLLIESKDLNAAHNILRNTKRASPFNYLLSNGQACDIEATPNHLLTDRVESTYYVHTNHCLQGILRPLDIHANTSLTDETHLRFSRMSELLHSLTSRGRIGFSDILQLLRDHENGHASICRHLREDIPPDGRIATVGAIISREGEDGIWVVWGNPCMNAPHLFYLDGADSKSGTTQ